MIVLAFIAVFIGLIVISILFILLYPGLGGRVSRSDKETYQKRTDESFYRNRKFTNGDGFAVMTRKHGASNVRFSDKRRRPKDDLPVDMPQFAVQQEIRELTYTWLGHSSFLIQMHGKNILVDPILQKHSSPFSWIGPTRFSKVPVKVEELPRIDLVIYSHDHFDHLDFHTLKKLKDKAGHFIVPLGVERHLISRGIDRKRITVLSWWEEYETDGLTVACTPTQHFSGRRLFDANDTLWSSVVLKDEHYQVYYSGDGGMNDRFRKIHDRYGDFDLAIMECGQYSPSWAGVHMFPEEAVDAADQLGADFVTPVHWGAFVLSDHPWDDPAERFTREYEGKHEATSHLLTPRLGETITISKDSVTETTRWWREYN